MTSKRMRFLTELLDFMGLGGRLRLEWFSSAEANKFVKVITEFTEAIRSLGPSPLRQDGGALAALELTPPLESAQSHACSCSHAAAPPGCSE